MKNVNQHQYQHQNRFRHLFCIELPSVHFVIVVNRVHRSFGLFADVFAFVLVVVFVFLHRHRLIRQVIVVVLVVFDPASHFQHSLPPYAVFLIIQSAVCHPFSSVIVPLVRFPLKQQSRRDRSILSIRHFCARHIFFFSPHVCSYKLWQSD